MNKARRAALRKISSQIESVKDLIGDNNDSVIAKLEALSTEIDHYREEEEECADNMPENLQYTARYDDAMEAINEMENAIDYIADAITAITENDFDEATSNIEDAIDSVDNAAF